MVETFSVEHPFSSLDQNKMDYAGEKSMHETWTNMLADVVAKSGGSAVADPSTSPTGDRIKDITSYLDRVLH